MSAFCFAVRSLAIGRIVRLFFLRIFYVLARTTPPLGERLLDAPLQFKRTKIRSLYR